MKKRVLAMLLAVAMIVAVFAACGSNNPSSSSQASSSTASSETSSAASSETSSDSSSEPASSEVAAGGPDDTSEKYAFTVYYNYTGWTRKWGVDEASKYMNDKFNIDVNWYGPDSDPDAKLNLMVSSDDLPEAIVMERGGNNIKLANAGVLVPLQPYMYEGNLFEKFIAPATVKLLQIDGKNYGIPNWARTGATGGNYQWQFSKKVLNALGEYDTKWDTMEKMHDYAVKVKNANLTTDAGESIYPVMFREDASSGGYYVYWPFYRALGAPNLIENYYTQENGKIQFLLESETMKKAISYANDWFNEGLFSADQAFTDSHDQFKEKISNGRAGILWYDFSQDDGENYRRALVESSKGEDDWMVLGSEYYQEDSPMFPGLEGNTYIFGDENGTVGWNVNCITKAAERPQRIFDLFSWMISDEGSVNMMYGPEGGTMLKSVVYKDGEMPAVTLNKPASEFSQAEQDAAGAWFWSQPANSDYVDGIKFALNDTLPQDQRNWVVSIQAHMCSFNEENPRIGQKFITDQCTGLNGTIDQQEDLGVSRQQIVDQCRAELPKIIMASTKDEMNKKIDDLLQFAKSNNVDEICARYQALYDQNIATQGFDAYSKEYNVYKQ